MGSPKPQIKRSPRPSVRSCKEQFEKDNRHHKNVKEVTKENSKYKRACRTPNTSPEPEKKEEDPVIALMKKLSADFQSVKTEIKEDSNKIDKITDKIDQLERNSIRNEMETKNEFNKIKKDMTENKIEIEEKINQMKEENKSLE